MKPLAGPLRMEKTLLFMAVGAAVLFATAPSVFGFSTGMNSDVGLPPDFNEMGCAAAGCHGDHQFAPGPSKISWTILGPEGEELTGAVYRAGDTYRIEVNLTEEVAPDEGNHAGFYLSASAGVFETLPGTNVQITGGGAEASHTDASTTSWAVEWTAPESGAVAFTLIVNDVDGDRAPSPGDNVYRAFFGLSDEAGAQLGAAEEEEIHYGVSLPQYWLGLVALASMIFVILFAFVYLKFFSPHHADQKDR